MPSAVDRQLDAGPNLAAVAPLAATTVSTESVPVYWLGVNGNDIQLYREFRSATSTGEPISTAIRAMTSADPDDPDYFSPWRPARSVSATVSSNNTITVDLPSEAFAAPLDEGVAQRAVQQLVYTATAAAENAGVLNNGQAGTVVILVDGRTGYTAFDHVLLGEPMRRDSRFLAPAWITDPQEGQVHTGSEVTISGSGVSADSLLEWQITPVESHGPDPLDSRPSISGDAVLGSPAGAAGPYSISAELPPGKYRISVADRSGEGKRINVDTKEFTVKAAADSDGSR